MRFHEPAINYVVRRTEEGRTKREIMRCRKRSLIRDIWQILVISRKKKDEPFLRSHISAATDGDVPETHALALLRTITSYVLGTALIEATWAPRQA
jgi:hypothetical protein